jgi:uncharacterized membrane protein
MMDGLFIENGPTAILVAALITYSFRLGGLLLADILPRTGPLRSFLDALPGSILIALVIPGALESGWHGLVGITVCLIAFTASRRMLPTMVLGVLAVYLLRLI